MRIAVCDDEKYMRNEIKEHLDDFSHNSGYEILVDEFCTGTDLLSSRMEYDVIFLDYQMPCLNGMDTARKLKEKNVQTAIIFLTSYSEIVYDTFEVSAFRFLTKPIDKAKFIKAMRDYTKTIRTAKPVIIKIENKTFNINSEDIIYIEAANKESIIQTKSKEYKCPYLLTEVEKLLPNESFFRTHRSYIVNLIYVKDYDEKIIKFFNGESALLSRSNFNRFTKKYINFMKHYTF